MKKIYYFAIVALFCVAAASCSKEESNDVKQPSIEELLVGKWESDEDNDFDMYIELKLNEDGDGRSKCEYPDDPDVYVAKIEWEYEKGRKDDILYITEFWEEEDKGEVYEYEYELIIESISKDELVLILDEDDEYEFTFKRK